MSTVPQTRLTDRELGRLISRASGIYIWHPSAGYLQVGLSDVQRIRSAQLHVWRLDHESCGLVYLQVDLDMRAVRRAKKDQDRAADARYAELMEEHNALIEMNGMRPERGIG
jgi:hypothetical protein